MTMSVVVLTYPFVSKMSWVE